MTPEEHSWLERTVKLTEENNNMLRSIRRSSRVSTIMRIAYWVIIIVLSFAAYYFIQPYGDFLLKLSGGSIGNIQNTATQFQNLLN